MPACSSLHGVYMAWPHAPLMMPHNAASVSLSPLRLLSLALPLSLSDSLGACPGLLPLSDRARLHTPHTLHGPQVLACRHPSPPCSFPSTCFFFVVLINFYFIFFTTPTFPFFFVSCPRIAVMTCLFGLPLQQPLSSAREVLLNSCSAANGIL